MKYSVSNIPPSINNNNNFKMRQLKTLINTRYFKLQKDHTFDWLKFNLRNDTATRELYFYEDDFFSKSIGTISKLHSKDYAYFIDVITGLEGEYEGNLESDLTEDLRHYNSVFNNFSNFMWFVKDNSVNVENSYVYLDKPPSSFVLRVPSYDEYSNCYGNFEDTIWSECEIKKAIEIFEKYISMFSGREVHANKVWKENKFYVDSENEKHNYSITNPIDRAITFLDLARGTNNVIAKISLYVAIYECLFTIDSFEIVHKVAERTARYYSEDKNERLRVFKLIKESYDIRSNFFHGSQMRKDKQIKISYLANLSKSIDDLTRNILTRIIIEDSEVFCSNSLEEYFNDKLF